MNHSSQDQYQGQDHYGTINLPNQKDNPQTNQPQEQAIEIVAYARIMECQMYLHFHNPLNNQPQLINWKEN